MDLKEFTKQTLMQIVEGAAEANAELSNGAYIPYHVPNNSKGRYIYDDGANVVDVDFDVAITAIETESANGGASLKVASLLNIGGCGENKIENQTISRIKYTLPLVLAKKEQ